MRNSILTFFLIILSLRIHGQVKKTVTGDTVFWYKYAYNDAEKVKLPRLISSKENFHFRLHIHDQMLDIKSDDGSNFTGLITSYTETYVPFDNDRERQKSPKVYFKKVALDTSVAYQVYQLITTVKDIPTQNLIKGWGNGKDGETYILETSTPTTYNFWNYWSPESFRSITEAKTIATFKTKVDSLLNLKNEFELFFESLKPGRYIVNEISIRTKRSPEQIAYDLKMKPHRDYIKSIKPKLDAYLTDTLNKILVIDENLDNTDGVTLAFSKDNQLIDVFTFPEKRDSKETINKRKHYVAKIFEAFKLIKFDFVHAEYGYERPMHFWDGKIKISDY